MTPTIRNLTGFGSCEGCDDTGLVTAAGRVFDEHQYPHWCTACTACEQGAAKRVGLARRRDSWRYREVAA